MNFITGTTVAAVMLLAGFAAGFPLGKSDGFERGSEWALVQADIVARESGVFMPVYLDNGTFKVVIRQPRNIYKRAWKLADQFSAKDRAALWDRYVKSEETATATGTVALLLK